ncbi:hypothetical protein Ashraf_60 [Mycobacterium phage Ashraf]|uniref:Uncharacterized protein n=5 Tax=Pegunavirus oline TaxID=1986350 RepID=A0A162CJI8_9CAUD|nr:hypothetical protein PDRPv_63 [Mycobacterium phage PDRPv]AKF12453.1 hypothetical protein PDRPxv_63 [Mycobacterium phage PDRPxv]AQT25974.1 hypothetical protein Ashraf_60 [Mycobacterium phage Ashraf]AQT26078.1 hypothetical protein ImtiyazSitla_60 [Mycobacterium phage ImtiyazSitla]AQT26181.1 hypothetical protein Maskar_60 [Mycobacterium phage Maskar]
MTESCQHHYGNTGDGWLTCVKCGAAPAVPAGHLSSRFPVLLPARPSEYDEDEPVWNHYPFIRVKSDSIEIGPRSEDTYTLTVTEAEVFAADLLAAVRTVRSRQQTSERP